MTPEQYEQLKADRKRYKQYLRGRVIWPCKKTHVRVEKVGDKEVLIPLPYVKEIHGKTGEAI